MGDLGLLSSKSGVTMVDESLAFGSGSLSGSGPTHPDPGSISDDCLAAAEEAAQHVVNCIHPTLDSEEKRKDVIDYVQSLFKRHLDCEAFTYGSVPLKTYLPDGDIDLTAIKSFNADDSLARDVLAVLQAEQKNKKAEYEVKDAQFIDAEVKLVKCLVQNIVIDISFNQLGGLSTLCFLERVDRLVGKNHLFKRSIILVKAWCYYESRILGAHHGLISTYALETLVLYIFNLFYSSLDGPLAVLYRFLDYFSQFDWESYCISLKGPVCISSLPDIVVKMPESGHKDLMLSGEFLGNCIEMLSGSPRDLGTAAKVFQPKHLNIIDPLKETNNLGRSVHRGNFYRIRSAFRYGAHQLGRVLSQPRDKLADEIHEFFANTLARHERKHASVNGALLHVNEESLAAVCSEFSAELYSEDDMLLESSVSDYEYDSLGAEDQYNLEFNNELEQGSIRDISEMASETCSSADGLAVSGLHLAGDAYDTATPNSTLRIENNKPDFMCCSNYCASLLGKHDDDSHYLSSKSSVDIGSLTSGNFLQIHQKSAFSFWLETEEKHAELNTTYRWCVDNSEVLSTVGSDSSSPKANSFRNSSHGCEEADLFSVAGESDATLNPLADLGGDYDSHIRNLLHGQLCTRFSPLFNPPSSLTWVHNKWPWDTVCQLMPLSRNQFTQMNSNTLYTEHVMGHVADAAVFNAAAGSEGKQKARGIGTYFPNMYVAAREKPSHGRGRSKPLGSRNLFQRNSRTSGNVPGPALCKSNSFEKSTREFLPTSGNVPGPALCKSNSFEKGTREFLPARSRAQGQGNSVSSPHLVKDDNDTIGFTNSLCAIEFGSLGRLTEEMISGLSCAFDSTLGVPMEGHGSTVTKQGGVTQQSLHLKNEDEFPPLCH